MHKATKCARARTEIGGVCAAAHSEPRREGCTVHRQHLWLVIRTHAPRRRITPPAQFRAQWLLRRYAAVSYSGVDMGRSPDDRRPKTALRLERLMARSARWTTGSFARRRTTGVGRSAREPERSIDFRKTNYARHISICSAGRSGKLLCGAGLVSPRGSRQRAVTSQLGRAVGRSTRFVSAARTHARRYPSKPSQREGSGSCLGRGLWRFQKITPAEPPGGGICWPAPSSRF
jgi:hypothetical protein